MIRGNGGLLARTAAGCQPPAPAHAVRMVTDTPSSRWRIGWTAGKGRTGTVPQPSMPERGRPFGRRPSNQRFGRPSTPRGRSPHRRSTTDDVTKADSARIALNEQERTVRAGKHLVLPPCSTRLHSDAVYGEAWRAPVNRLCRETRIALTSELTELAGEDGRNCDLLSLPSKRTLRMKIGTLFTVTSRMSLVGLFVLIGAFAIASTGAAQTDEACPLHASATPRADPPVTAQDVENGTGSLMDFTVAATERFRTLSETSDLLHYLCVIRQEGGALAFGLHLHHVAVARRQGVLSRERHGADGQAAPTGDLRGDPRSAGG